MEIRNARDAASYVAAWAGQKPRPAASYLGLAIEGLEMARAIIAHRSDCSDQILDLSEAIGVLRLGRLEIVQPKAERTAAEAIQ